MRTASLLALIGAALLHGPITAADSKPLFNGKNLDGWEIIGDGQWTVMADGTLVGQRITDLRKQLVPGGPIATAKDFSAGSMRNRGCIPGATISGNSICTSSIGPRRPATAECRFAIRPGQSGRSPSHRTTPRRLRRLATRSRSTTGIPIRIRRAAFTGSWTRRRSPPGRRLERDGHTLAER